MHGSPSILTLVRTWQDRQINKRQTDKQTADRQDEVINIFQKCWKVLKFTNLSCNINKNTLYW